MSHRDFKSELSSIGDAARVGFTQTHEVREQALRLARRMVQNSAGSIRATHRGEVDRARDMLTETAGLAAQVDTLLKDHRAVYFAGYVEDALKEYAEASATLVFAEGGSLQGPADLGMGPAPYLNGLAEAVGELRRFILDSLRREEFARCEELLGVMDEIYTVLVTMDFPDAITRGLRRSTDMARSVLERTRGDLTMALRQRRLEQNLAQFQRRLESASDETPDGGQQS